MSRYLEEAAGLLRSQSARLEKHAANSSLPRAYHDELLAVASQFAALAAIDKGLLPAELTADVLHAITDRSA